jgi:spermidine synthase
MTGMSSRSGLVATAATERGELVLRRRESDEALELRVNGVFVMDDRETTTERMLASTTLDALVDGAPGGAWRVLIAGLGLGFTMSEVLADPRVGSVLVAEIEPDLVSWHRSGLIPGSQLDDPRVEVLVGDVRDAVWTLPSRTLDLILLDVDNGPDFLVYDENAAVYRTPFLSACRDALTPGGLIAVWSSSASPDLVSTLSAVFGSCVEQSSSVTLGSRETTYHLFIAPD